MLQQMLRANKAAMRDQRAAEPLVFRERMEAMAPVIDWPLPRVHACPWLRQLVEVAQGNRALIERTWHEYFS